MAESYSDRAAVSDDEIRSRLKDDDPAKRLVITPILSLRIQGATVDIRLGTKFITGRRTRHTKLDPVQIEPVEARQLQERHEVGFWEQFVIHPQQLVLGCTLEYLSLPADLSASVISRSSYGRSGLMAATATHVHPRYKGCLTLELVNLGDVPIVLRPGLRIAQLVFSRSVASEVPQKYSLATAPEFPHLWDDSEDRAILRSLAKDRLSV